MSEPKDCDTNSSTSTESANVDPWAIVELVDNSEKWSGKN